MHSWKVVPISNNQRLDVRPEDLLKGGLFRKCSTYRGGGGYDKFPDICERRLGRRYSEQFIVQLFGCNLDCPYCYVTREGVWGQPVKMTTTDLVTAFIESGQQTFHLMGGAPALQLPHWPELIRELERRCPEAVFHSDMMLTERGYMIEQIDSISRPNTLYAVNIKGWTEEEHLRNTRRPLDGHRMAQNFLRLLESDLLFYFTFTNINVDHIDEIWQYVAYYAEDKYPQLLQDSFSIGLIDYDAMPFVDSVPWGQNA